MILNVFLQGCFLNNQYMLEINSLVEYEIYFIVMVSILSFFFEIGYV